MMPKVGITWGSSNSDFSGITVLVLLEFSFSFGDATHQGPVVRRLISANPRLNFNLVFFIPLFKCLVGIVFRVLYRASNNHILDKKNSTEFSFKTVKSEIRFHTNPGLS